MAGKNNEDSRSRYMVKMQNHRKITPYNNVTKKSMIVSIITNAERHTVKCVPSSGKTPKNADNVRCEQRAKTLQMEACIYEYWAMNPARAPNSRVE